MKRAALLIIIGTTVLSGCTFYQEKFNELESNSFVAYVPVDSNSLNPPIQKGGKSNFLPSYDPNVAKANLQGDEFHAGDCIMVVMNTGNLNQNFETWFERKLIGEDKTRNEISFTSQVYETPTELPAGTTAPGKQLSIHESKGQLKSRPLTVDNLILYGPRKYYGGPITFSLYVSEKDHDELTKVKKDITDSTKIINAQLPEGSKTTFKDFVAAGVNGATLDAFGYVAIGAQAIDLFADVFYQLNEQDDVVMKANFTLLQTGTKSKTYQSFLREGYFPVVRLSTNESYPAGLSGLVLDPQSGEVKMSGHHQTSLTLQITKPSSCPI
ncbi:hypothetical protein PS858_00524 [Pseudomonas fluorescens]|uniref:hypothetical protein n=1 Tax=Pseudomonas fluorescens TaxID=294 RepID=UPI0012400367|nr:hypothetical protein [Pseudomonas fluorescens]VVO55894.1 hypothetical protein PS858_00524 [Pseudomonas fluorescens]